MAHGLPGSRTREQVLEPPHLRELYEEENLPVIEIAAMAGCATATIRWLLKHDGVPPRRSYRRPPPESGISRVWLHREYVDKLRSMNALARERGVTADYLMRLARNWGLPIRHHSEYSGIGHLDLPAPPSPAMRAVTMRAGAVNRLALITRIPGRRIHHYRPDHHAARCYAAWPRVPPRSTPDPPRRPGGNVTPAPQRERGPTMSSMSSNRRPERPGIVRLVFLWLERVGHPRQAGASTGSAAGEASVGDTVWTFCFGAQSLQLVLPGRAGAEKRTVRIRITPAPDPQASIDIDFNDGQGFQRMLDFAAPQPVPDSYRFGFAASTGAVHRRAPDPQSHRLHPHTARAERAEHGPACAQNPQAFAGLRRESNKSLVRVHVGQHQHHRSAKSTRQNDKSFHRLFARSADRRR